MVNLETLKKEVYQRERKKLFHKFLFGNILIVLFFSITFSGTRVTEREKELMVMSKELRVKNDSLLKLNTVELVSLKETENRIIRKSLTMNKDTSYVDEDYNLNDMYNYVENQKNTYNTIEKIADNKWDSISRIPFGMPITLADINDFTDGFGYRKDPIDGKIRFHEGIDVSVVRNTNVFATADGVVEKAGWLKNYGNRIVINHGNGYRTVYAHLEKLSVKEGQIVKRFDLIAMSGNTGKTTGPHLHYEILIKNRPINPEKFFINDFDKIAMDIK